MTDTAIANEKNADMKDTILTKMRKVYDNLLNLEDVGKEYAGSTKSDDELEKIGVFKRDFGMEQWDWPQGVGLMGLSIAKDYLTDVDYPNYISNWFKARLHQGLPCKNVNTTAPLATLVDFDFAQELAQEWITWVMQEANRTEERGLQHDVTARDIRYRTLNPEQIWVDTLIMANLFTAKMGALYDNDTWRNEALYQLLLHTKYLQDPKTKLFFHGWTFKERNHFGDVLWCRGNAWMAIGIPLTLEVLDDFIQPSVREYILTFYRNQIDSLLENYLDKEKYLWHTVLTNPASYVETSGTAGILAGILMGIQRGYLAKDKYLPVCEKILLAVLDQIDYDGVVGNVSAGTPIQMTEQEYMDIVIAPMGYGQALTLIMLSVALPFYS